MASAHAEVVESMRAVRWHATVSDLLTPASDVQPHPANPNSGDTQLVRESIERNGVYRPIVAQRSTGYILAGHTAYAAEVALQAERSVAVPLVPVSWVDCDDATALRIVSADNATAAHASLDDELVRSLLAELDDELDGTGYTDDDFSALIARLADDDDDTQLASGDADPALGEDTLSIIVTCRDERQQGSLLERFEAEGLVCRALMM